MGNLGKRRFELALLAGLIIEIAQPAGLLAAEPDGDAKSAAKQKTSTSWFTGRASSKKKEETCEGVAAKDCKTGRTANPVADVQQTAGIHAHEEATWLRRRAVCDKLREIAERNKDEALKRQVEQLEDRIWAIYLQHTQLPVGKSGSQSDEACRDPRKVSGTVSRDRRPDSPLYSVTSADRAGHTEAGEEKP